MSFDSFHIRELSESASSGGRVPQKRTSRIVRYIRWVIARLPRTRKGVIRLGLKLIGLGIVGGILYAAFLWTTLPDLDDPASLLAAQSTVITDRNGVELYRLFSEEDRTYIPGKWIPDSLKQATIAIEDERFFKRGCIDVRAIGRAVLANIFDFKSQGASTITQQLARNALLTREKRFTRKVKELMLACQLENEMNKEELLDLYLNWIPFGQNAYGIEQASQVYFSKAASGLTLAESVVLASLPQRPTYLSPYGKNVHTSVNEEVEEQIQNGSVTDLSSVPDESIRIGLLGQTFGTGAQAFYIGGRTDQVLRNMQDQGFIEESDRLAALDELAVMEFVPSRENIRAPHFVLWVRDAVEEMFAGTLGEGLLEQGGLTIETTLDWNLQEIAEGVIAFHREDILERFGAYNISLVSTDPKTGEILAYVGNTDYNDQEHGGKIDMALAPRQPGSSFKPFIYAAAFRNGFGPADILYDVPTKIGDNEPQNFDGEFMGLMTMRQALGASRNIPAAKAYFLAGEEERILQLVHSLGAPTPLNRKRELQEERGEFDYGWPLSIGAAETPLFEMVQAYTTLAGAGAARPLEHIRKITDKHGNILYELQHEESTPVIDPRIAYQVTSSLSDESVRPEEYWKTQLTIPGYETAAKTGTSNKCLEWEDENTCLLRKPDNAWLMGYTPNLVTGVWVGNANSASMYEKAGGLNTASPVWRDYMMRAHRDMEEPEEAFEVPDDIVQPQVSMLSGQLPTECTPVDLRRADVFLKEHAPTEPDPNCVQLTIDKVTKLLASDACPSDAHDKGSFLVVKSLFPERFPEWEEGVQAWFDEQMELWYATDNHSGATIKIPRAPTEECDPKLTPGRLVKPSLDIIYPQSGGTASYPSFKPKLSYSVGSIIHEMVYSIDGKRIAKRTSEPFDSPLRVPRSIKESGTHKLTVTLTDEYFNTVSQTVSFRFDEDKELPTVKLLNPTDGRRLIPGETIRLRASASDANGGLKYVQFFVGETLLSTKPKKPFELEYKIDLSEGNYTIRAVAEDFAKNRAEDSVEVTVGGLLEISN